MLKIKVTIPNCPSGAVAKFLPKGGDMWHNCQFFVNQEVDNPDYWLVIDDLNSQKEITNIDSNRVFFLSAELPFVTSYFNDQEYLSQFSKIYSPHAIYHHHNNITALPFLPFMINSVYGQSVFTDDRKYNYDKLLNNNGIKKTKTLSIIASNKGSSQHNMTEFHKIRYHFAQRLKDHFKDKIDLFGYGYNEIKTKVEAIVPYKYHICLENQATENVITEKLYDSFLGLAYPIYWGAPNVHDYFAQDALTRINIMDFKGSVRVIEQVLAEDLYEKNLDNLIRAKNDVLNKYGIFQRIAEICEHDAKNNISQDKTEVILLSRNSFIKKEHKKIKKIKKIAKYAIPSIIIYEIIKQYFTNDIN